MVNGHALKQVCTSILRFQAFPRWPISKILLPSPAFSNNLSISVFSSA